MYIQNMQLVRREGTGTRGREKRKREGEEHMRLVPQKNHTHNCADTRLFEI